MRNIKHCVYHQNKHKMDDNISDDNGCSGINMSGRRCLMPLEKIKLPPGRQLPEIIHDRVPQTPDTFDEEISSLPDRKLSFRMSDRGLSHNSTLSSATSQRFPDMFHRTDWPSLSDTGTDSPDFLELEGSDSSASSMFSWADNEGTRLVAEEWEKVQRTLYDEEGPKVTQKHLKDECNQWKEMFPHIRVVGHNYGASKLEDEDSYDTEEEVLALHYDSDKEEEELKKTFFKANNALTQANDNQRLMPLRTNNKSFTQNSPMKYSNSVIKKKSSAVSLVEELDSFLHITPLNKLPLQSDFQMQRLGTSTLVKSELSSSRWQQRKNVHTPDFVSLPFNFGNNPQIKQNQQTRDSSAASLYSNISKRNILVDDSKVFQNHNAWKSPSSISASRKLNNMSERQTHILDPIEVPARPRIPAVRSVSIPQANDVLPKNSAHMNRNISLPPIQSDENKGKRKQVSDFSTSSGKSYLRNKKTLEPINNVSTSIPRQNIGVNAPLNDIPLIHSKTSRNKKRSTRKNKK